MQSKTNNRISELLKLKNMTQKELALKAEITESAISHYIKGDRVPRGAILIKIARALEVTTDDILNKEYDFSNIKLLIARNAQNMNLEEKAEIIKILLNDTREDKDE